MLEVIRDVVVEEETRHDALQHEVVRGRSGKLRGAREINLYSSEVAN